jgi:hypothetical protein
MFKQRPSVGGGVALGFLLITNHFYKILSILHFMKIRSGPTRFYWVLSQYSGEVLHCLRCCEERMVKFFLCVFLFSFILFF